MRQYKNILIALLLLTLIDALPSTAQVSVDKKSQNLGALRLYSQNVSTFTLKNTTSRPIEITKIVCSSSVMDAVSDRTTIPARGAAVITVTDRADLVGRYTKAVYVYTSAAQKPVTLTLKGRVFLDPDLMMQFSGEENEEDNFSVDYGDLSFSTDNIEFDYVNDGDIVSKTIFVTNKGSEPCKPNLLHLPSYLSVKATPAELRPGRKGYLTVTLDSRKLNHNLGLTQDVVYASSFEGENVAPDKEIPVSIVLFDTTTVLRSNMAPEISLSTNELRLPKSNKAKLRGTVTISNTGHSPLEIKSLQVFHPAVNVSLPKTTLAPDEKVQMKVTLVRKYFDRSTARHRILMITNDYRNPVVLISILH